MAIIDRSFTGNVPKILAAQMKWEVLEHHFWGKFAKFNAPKAKVVVRKGNIPKPIASPIVMQHELERTMGDEMKIPMLRNLVNLPTYGRDQMEGFEEEQFVNHAVVPIDIVRHAVQPQEGIMMTQTTKDYQFILNSKPQLVRHYAQVEEFLGCGWSLFYGFSRNILGSVRFSGHSTIKAISHPHIFLAGQGKVSYGVSDYPGTANYETNIGTALNAMNDTNIYDTNFLSGLKSHQTMQEIDPIIAKDGNEFWLMVVHPYQIHTLEQDPKFNVPAATVYAQQMAKDNPMITGCKYFWGGFAIFVSDTAAWPVSVSGTTGKPIWGPSTITNLQSFRSYSTYQKFAGVVIGNNALYKATGNAFEYKQRTRDYEEILGIAYRVVEGYSRADSWNDDDGTRGAYVKNYGSAVFVTWAEEPSM